MNTAMPDEAYEALREAGFQVEIEGEMLIARLSCRRVTRGEVAEVLLDYEPGELRRAGPAVRVPFTR